MHIVPVIDIKGGQAVRAIAGRREQYQPMHSELCHSSELPAILEALRAWYPFDTFYLADIDRLMNRGDNRAAITALCKQYPQSKFWLDAGFSRPQELDGLKDLRNVTPVFGSESIGTLNEYQALSQATQQRCILSLDYLHNRFRGPVELEHRRNLWPAEVLIMELDRVGTGGGPHYDRLAEYAGEQRRYRVYAAGGVRGIDDLRRLEESCVDGALIATALHGGALNPEILASIATQPSR